MAGDRRDIDVETDLQRAGGLEAAEAGRADGDVATVRRHAQLEALATLFGRLLLGVVISMGLTAPADAVACFAARAGERDAGVRLSDAVDVAHDGCLRRIMRGS